jgi:hypothetical protein
MVTQILLCYQCICNLWNHFIICTTNLESLRVVFPAACGEFVIPAEAGIQKTGLDSASSAE